MVMGEIRLKDYQQKAVNQMKNGSVLCGGVGSGKSITALYYYLTKVCLGSINPYRKMERPKDLYIITTAKKRDSLEWNQECSNLCLYPENNGYGVKVTIDSWNNIKKYQKVYGAFFIFDEQRVVGYGAWVKAFLDIARKNQWVLLTATPADTYSDLIPVFVANGFYKNKTDFNNHHCVFSRFSKYPKIERYVDERTLKEHIDDIMVIMKDDRHTVRIKKDVIVEWNRDLFRTVYRDRWDPYENEPIQESGKWIYLVRKVINSDASRLRELGNILKDNPKIIVFYNFSYELDLLRSYLDSMKYKYAEWNGEKHQDLPTGKKWVYLVQYSAGCEGWNCTSTDTMVFYSQSYSYRMTEQAAGRIDRMNTPYLELYYYYFRSLSPIDSMIHNSLKNKKNFNEKSLRKGW